MNPYPLLLAGELLFPFSAWAAGPPPEPVASLARGHDAAPASTAEAGRGWILPSPEQLEARRAVVGEVEIRVGDIFDPEDPSENNRIYMVANRLHRTTRDQVIQRLLLLQPGEPFSVYRMEESERILRAQGFLYDARIRPVAFDGEKVDLRVETRDVWTLKVGLSVSRSGGTNDTDFTLQDSNFLGTGKEVTLKRTSDVDRSGYLMRYLDPNLGGTRAQLELIYADNSDGAFTKLKLQRPFYSLETRRAAGLEYVEDDRTDTFYTLGRISHEFQHRATFAEAWTGFSEGLEEDRSHRWLAGFTYRRDQFSPTDRPVLQPPFADRVLTYPWIGFQKRQNKFAEVHDLNLIGRTEDLDLGHRVNVRAGVASKLFGGTEDQLIFAGDYSFGLQPRRGQLLLAEGYGSGRWQSEGLENLWLGFNVRYYWRNFGENALYASFGLDAVENLDPEHQLLLGGDTGLRGYPLRYQSGGRRALLTLEQRIYTNWHPFRLAYVGAAVFFDAGRTWTPGHDLASDRGTLTNVGLGLRISPSRSGLGSMFHLDVAFPLDAGADIEKVQWLFSTKESF